MGIIVSLATDLLNTAGYIGYSILKYLFNWDDQSAIENRAEPSGRIGDSELEAGIAEMKIEPSSKLEAGIEITIEPSSKREAGIEIKIEPSSKIEGTIDPFRTISYNDFKLASIRFLY